MTGHIEHARTELALMGENEVATAGYMKIMEAVDAMRPTEVPHSEMVAVVEKLLRFQNLAPISENPAEWEKSEVDPDAVDVNIADAPPIWQNLRNPSAMSYDGGQTYFLHSEPEYVYPTGRILDDGTIVGFPLGFYKILEEKLDENNVPAKIDATNVDILAWNCPEEGVWLIQFQIPAVGTDKFFDLGYDDQTGATALRVFQKEKTDG